MTRENRLLAAYSAVAGIVATAGGYVVAEVASALTFGELWFTALVVLTVLFAIASVPVLAAHIDHVPRHRQETDSDR